MDAPCAGQVCGAQASSADWLSLPGSRFHLWFFQKKLQGAVYGQENIDILQETKTTIFLKKVKLNKIK